MDARISRVLIGIASLLPACLISARANDPLHDIVAAFEVVSATARPLALQPGNVALPTGGHVQGIQFLADAANHRVLAFLSHDSQEIAYVLVVAFPDSLTEPGEIIHIHNFPRDGLRHAGGIQLLGSILAVGLEDNRGKHRSSVQFWDVSQPKNWVLLKHLTISRQGLPKDKTAGAVGMVRHGDRTIVAVANWDSRAIDFYGSNGRELTDDRCRLEMIARWNADTDTGSWQAINLLSQANDELFLAGMHQDRRFYNAVELFRVDLSNPSQPVMTNVATRRFLLSKGNSFQSGAGVWIHGNTINFLATPHHLINGAKIDVLQPPVE